MPPWYVLIALLTLGILAGPSQAQVQDNRVGLVVNFGNGAVFTACVPHTPDMTGLDLLQRANLTFTFRPDGIGALICSIGAPGMGELGCRYPEVDCLCQARQQPWRYWAYWSLEAEGWRYSGFGASARYLQPGDVDGWAWGEGSVDEGARPPDLTFRDVCPLPTTTPTQAPTHTLTPIPTSTLTPIASLTPVPTRTFEPTITPIPTWTPIPSSTPEPTWTASPIPTATETATAQAEASATPMNGAPAPTWTPISLPTVAAWTTTVTPSQPGPPTATLTPLPAPPTATTLAPTTPAPGSTLLPGSSATPTATAPPAGTAPASGPRPALTVALTPASPTTVTVLPTLPQSVSLDATSLPAARVDLSRLTPVAATNPTASGPGGGAALNYGIFAALVVGLIAFLIARQRGLL